MNPSRLVRESLRAMRRYKLRSAFMMVGSFLGVAALTLVVSVGKGAERKVLSTVQQLFSASSIFVTSGGNLLAAGARGDGGRLTLADFEAVAASVPGIAVWDPLQIIDPSQARHRDADATVRVLGSSERFERVWERGVVRGEPFDAAAVARSARVALIGATVERALFGAGEDPLGAEILVGGVALRVIGLLEPMGTDAHGLDRDNEIVVPISTLMHRLASFDTIRGAKLLVRDPSRLAATAADIARLLRERHAIAPGQPDDFTLVTPKDVARLVGRMQQVFFVLLPLVAAIALLAGAVVAASLMLLSVNERRTEIALRRAVGARRRDITLQFLLETAAVTLAGGLAGVPLGALASYAIASRLGLLTFFSLGAALVGLAASALAGLAAGVLPARRAARLLPADGLR
jgi:putative ABC transport system permease protein